VDPSPPAAQSAPNLVIVGPLRAGTTLLRLMLNNHPQIAITGEFEESVAMLSDSGFPTPEEFRLWLTLHRTAASRNYQLAHHLSTYPDIVNAMWDQLAKPIDKPIIGCTIHSRFDRVRELWPSTKFIHITRDPRDVANSCVGMGWVGHAAKGFDAWTTPTKRWLSIVDQLDRNDWTQIRYEDLLTDPQAELTKCCTLVGLNYDPAMLDFHQVSSYQPLDPKLAEQWRRKMSPRTAEIIDAACTPLMQSLGYTPSIPNPKPANTLESLRITLHNRLGRFRWRIKRYGLWLVLKWAAFKRLSNKNPMRAAVRLKMNEIDIHHLR